MDKYVGKKKVKNIYAGTEYQGYIYLLIMVIHGYLKVMDYLIIV